MSLAEVNWSNVSSLSGSALKAEVFSIISDASVELQERAVDDPQVGSIVPRLAELMQGRDELASFREMYSALARSVGLWNYIDREAAETRDRIVAEAATIPELGFALHREQVTALETLLDGRNLILSAPTSFGKSVLVDALLLHDRFRRVAIVLPTIALLDEFRRRLVQRFGGRFDVLMHHTESSESERVIYLGTQERLINRDDLGYLDLVVVDEFYKLDPNRKDQRSVTLNAAVYRLLNQAKQFFFLGPNIDNVQLSETSRWRFEFLKTRFMTVAVDTVDLKSIRNKRERLETEVYEERNWPALVFVSSPDRANKLAAELAGSGRRVGGGQAMANWMARNYGSRWPLSEAVRAGVAVHHGRVPRALASRFVRLFNDKKLPILICTSTLIEGVNTAAKSVLIYDKQIDRSDYDFFTFSNIRGRAGRLGQHYVGQVYLFHASPVEQQVEVTAPLFGDLDDAPDEFAVHVDEGEPSPGLTARMESLAERLGLLPSELRRYSSIGFDDIERFRDAVDQALRSGARLVWNGRPQYDELRACFEVICSVKPPREFGVFSASQLTMYVHRLRLSSSMLAFFGWHASSYRGDERQVDNVFRFLRSAEFNLPEFLSLVELFVKRNHPTADYSLLTAELPRWFRAESLKMLEEEGVPIQIAERFVRTGDTVGTLSRRLRELALGGDVRLSTLERSWILDALPG